MQPVETWILQNPAWVEGPISIWMAGVILIMLAIAIRRGPREAREIISRHPGLFFGTLIPAVAWALYGYAVTGGGGL